MKKVEHGNIECQKRVINRMRAVLLGKATDVGSSAVDAAVVALVSLQPDVRSATSTSSANLIVLEGPRLRPRNLYTRVAALFNT